MPETKPIILYDTDMDTDCDDAGALAILYEYVRRDKAELAGIVADVVCPYAAPCCEALGDFYGIRRPVGTVYAAFCPDDESDRLRAYRAHSANCDSRRYNRFYAEKLGKTDRDYPSAASVYRRILADAPDHSVTVLCVGMLTAADDALVSCPDSISPLTGRELFERKVKRVISMAEPDSRGPNFNWDMDAPAAERFLRDCPVPVYVSGAGTSVITGASLTDRMPENHPLRHIYETWLRSPHKGRSSWDLIAALYALEGDSPWLTTEARGDCRYDCREHRSFWETESRRGDHEILVRVPDGELAAVLEARMTGNF
ncbi:MAG: hypothetical protein IJD06_11990 [Clostridia bacterium]|nr:hypothetical protein [Clostridia bacterium]